MNTRRSWGDEIRRIPRILPEFLPEWVCRPLKNACKPEEGAAGTLGGWRRPGRFPGTGENPANFPEFLRDPVAGLRLSRWGRNLSVRPVIIGRHSGHSGQIGRLFRQFL